MPWTGGSGAVGDVTELERLRQDNAHLLDLLEQVAACSDATTCPTCRAAIDDAVEQEQLSENVA